MTSPDGPAVEVTVYSREDCHLCEEAIADVERAAEDVGATVAIEEIDVDEDEQLAAEYGERVPYVLLDGEPAYKYRVDSFDLRRRLRDRTGEE